MESRASRRIFLRSFYGKAFSRFFSGFKFGRGIGCYAMGCSRSLSCEVVRAVLFVGGGTPIHSFVNPPALRQSSRAAGDLTPSILLRPSRGRRPSQSKRRSAGNTESTDNFRLALASTRASSMRKRRADANRIATTFFLRLLLAGFLAHRRGSTMTVLGEAEVGSAGTQPTKE